MTQGNSMQGMDTELGRSIGQQMGQLQIVLLNGKVRPRNEGARVPAHCQSPFKARVGLGNLPQNL